jgi:hypothetical protein
MLLLLIQKQNDCQTGASVHFERSPQKATDSSPGRVVFTAQSLQHVLSVSAEGKKSTEVKLWGPRQGVMTPFVDENLNAQVRVKLTRRGDGVVLFDELGLCGGMEIMWHGG